MTRADTLQENAQSLGALRRSERTGACFSLGASPGLADSVARELWPKGIHVAPLIIDGAIGEAGVSQEEGEVELDPEAIAESYWLVAQQKRGAWSFELDLRPHRA